MEIDLIIKLGGSAITDKSKLHHADVAAIESSSQLIASCYNRGIKLIVVLGAGSFGHFEAKQYAVNQGLCGDCDEKRIGFSKTRNAVLRLQAMVVEAIVARGVPAVAISVSSSWLLNNRDVVSHNADQITAFIDRGFVPVLHGDCVLDEQLGFCVLSGDTIIKELCRSFSVRRVVFVSSVSGIFDRPPAEEGATLIPLIKVNRDGDMSVNVETNVTVPDVTGGIRLKMGSAVAILQQGRGHPEVFVTCMKNAPPLCLLESHDGVQCTLFALSA